MKKLQYKISAGVVDEMNYIRKKDTNTFYYLIRVLRTNGWTLQDIGTAFGVSKSAVASWEKISDGFPNAEVLEYLIPHLEEKPVHARMTSTGPKREPAAFCQADQDEVLKLTKEARVVSKNTSLNAPSRKSAVKLEKMLLDLNETGVSMARLANAAGVSRRAIAQRINKAREVEKYEIGNNETSTVHTTGFVPSTGN